jgi:hypothetical protein
MQNKIESKNIAVAGSWAFVIIVSIGYFWNEQGTFLVYLILFALAMIFTGALSVYAPNGEKVHRTEQSKQTIVAL